MQPPEKKISYFILYSFKLPSGKNTHAILYLTHYYLEKLNALSAFVCITNERRRVGCTMRLNHF